MGELSDAENARLGISRADQDAFAAESHAARGRGARAPGRGDRAAATASPRTRASGRDTTRERLASLPAAFTREGTITAGNASQLSDGAAAGILTTARRAAGGPRAARRGGRARRRRRAPTPPSTCAPRKRATQAARAPRAAARRTSTCGRSTRRSPASPWRPRRALEIDPGKVNVNGGAVALGHPLAASGFRLLLTLAHQMRRDGAALGVATHVRRRRPGRGRAAAAAARASRTRPPRARSAPAGRRARSPAPRPARGRAASPPGPGAPRARRRSTTRACTTGRRSSASNTSPTAQMRPTSGISVPRSPRG